MRLAKMTQVRRSDSTKNLMAILTVVVGLVVGYLVIEQATQSDQTSSLGLNEVKGSVSDGGQIRTEHPGGATAIGSTPETPEGSSASARVSAASGNEPTVDTSSASVALGNQEHTDRFQPVEPTTSVVADSVAVANDTIELSPPAAIAAPAPEQERNTLDTTESTDRLVLRVEDTTIVARRYVEDTSVAEKQGLKLATTFASATRIVPFAFNRVGIGPEGEAAIKELVPIALKADKVHVRGRTDSKGAFEVNKRVALERAYTVREKFVEAGVPTDKLGISFCTECFIASNDTEAGRRENRRVDVEFIMPAEDIETLPETTYAKPLPETARTLSFARSLGSMDRDDAN